MALVKCKECGNEVSRKAKACPKCGAPPPKSWGGFAVLGGAVIVIGIANAVTPNSTTSPPATCPTVAGMDLPATAPGNIGVKITAVIQGDPLKPTVTGRTNLPVGTKLTITLERAASYYKAESEAAVVADGCFSTAPFTQDNDPINPGQYNLSARMTASTEQPDAVRNLIGNRGENLSGPLVRSVPRLGKVAEYKSTYAAGVADAEKDAEAKRKFDAKAEQQRANTRLTLVLLVARGLKENLRNPSSADWVNVLANNDASVVCIVLRAQNGFGGMNVDSYTFARGKLRQDADAWNTWCAGKSLYDLTDSVKWRV